MTNVLFFINQKKTFTLIIFLCWIMNIQAQEIKNEFWSHVRFGGNLGLSFEENYYSATIAPSAIYDFNGQFSAGLGLNATFNNQEDTYKSTIIGGSVITLYNPINTIQLSGEFEQLHINQKFDNSAFVNQNYWLPALYLGVAYRSGYASFGVRYDVLYNREKGIYANPWSPFFRVYF